MKAARAVEVAPATGAERRLRVQLAAAYRIADHLGWSELIYTHISLRVPGPEHHFLINPYGLRFDEVTASNLVKIDMDGKPVWSKPMDALKMRMGWGSASSPALHNGRLYIVNDNDEGSYVAAFEARTGTELWRVARDEGSNWTTPYVWQHERGTEIVTTGTRKVRSYDTSGKLLWELSGMSSIHVPTPFAHNGLLYVSSGYTADAKRPVYVIKPGATGDISLKPDESSNAFIVWSHPTLASHHPSGLLVGGRYYTLLDRGFLTANDAATGAEIYGRQRISAEASGFTASPWSYNGRIFALSEDGDTFVIQAGPEFKLLGKNSLGEMTLATPAIARGSLFIRTATKLYRIARPRP